MQQTAAPTPQTRKAEWESYDAVRREKEMAMCAASYLYFIFTYIFIFDAKAQGWIPFDLYPEQIDLLDMIHENQQVVALKARQLGITWLVLAYILWLMIFRAKAVVLIYSKRDDEAMYLLGKERLRGMYKLLPSWMQSNDVTTDNSHQFGIENGSIAYSFPTSGGDGYTANFAYVDEADLVPDLELIIRSVKPSVDAGGKFVLTSRVDKGKPKSTFKQIYRAAKQKLNDWSHAFLSWRVRPERTQTWYDKECQDSKERNGSLDYIFEQYPETDEEALMAKTLDKRIAPMWLKNALDETKTPLSEKVLKLAGAPAINGLLIYRLPRIGRKYVSGADPAEGNPNSDDSVCVWLDDETGEEVACLAGKFEPSTFASHINSVGMFFNRAPVLPERNNHGHAVILWLKDNGKVTVLKGKDKKDGWLSNSVGKTMLYDTAADAFRDGEITIHTYTLYLQLMGVEGSTLRAPEGENEDYADAGALAILARKRGAHRPMAMPVMIEAERS